MGFGGEDPELDDGGAKEAHQKAGADARARLVEVEGGEGGVWPQAQTQDRRVLALSRLSRLVTHPLDGTGLGTDERSEAPSAQDNMGSGSRSERCSLPPKIRRVRLVKGACAPEQL